MPALIFHALLPAIPLGMVAGLYWQSWTVGLLVAAGVILGEAWVVLRFVRAFG